MVIRTTTGFVAAALVAAGVTWAVTPTAAQDEKTESRKQAVLQLTGEFVPDRGGFKVTAAPTEGPGANLELPNAAQQTRGILEKGDVITAVEGKAFRDRREFLDLMNDANARNNGRVRITVTDVSTGRAVVWVARPVVIQMEVPVANRPPDFLEDLGDPVPAAPSVPTVPGTIDD